MWDATAQRSAAKHITGQKKKRKEKKAKQALLLRGGFELGNRVQERLFTRMHSSVELIGQLLGMVRDGEVEVQDSSLLLAACRSFGR